MFRCTARLVACLFLCGTLFAAERPNVWLDVPFVKEEKNACGAASMAMVMQLGIPAKPNAKSGMIPNGIPG
jgi:hypothetical protein